MNIFVAGIGPGNYDLITLSALEYAKLSDIIIVPRADIKATGISERVIMHHVKDKMILPVHFPMIRDKSECIRVIHEQLVSHDWHNINNIFFPVLGDSMLYSTGDYLVHAFRKINPDVNLKFIPGISAHSLAASYVYRQLAIRDEIFSVVSGTSERERIIRAIENSDVIAIYKPRAVKGLGELISRYEFRKIIRVDNAGMPDKERIYEGNDSLDDIHEYMSIIILWK